MPRVGFEPTISAGERPKTYALDRAATGTGTQNILLNQIPSQYLQNSYHLSPHVGLMGGEVKKKRSFPCVCLPRVASKKQENTVEQQIHGKNNKNNDNQSLNLFNKAFLTALVTQHRTMSTRDALVRMWKEVAVAYSKVSIQYYSSDCLLGDSETPQQCLFWDSRVPGTK